MPKINNSDFKETNQTASDRPANTEELVMRSSKTIGELIDKTKKSISIAIDQSPYGRFKDISYRIRYRKAEAKFHQRRYLDSLIDGVRSSPGYLLTQAIESIPTIAKASVDLITETPRLVYNATSMISNTVRINISYYITSELYKNDPEKKAELQKNIKELEYRRANNYNFAKSQFFKFGGAAMAVGTTIAAPFLVGTNTLIANAVSSSLLNAASTINLSSAGLTAAVGFLASQEIGMTPRTLAGVAVNVIANQGFTSFFNKIGELTNKNKDTKPNAESFYVIDYRKFLQKTAEEMIKNLGKAISQEKNIKKKEELENKKKIFKGFINDKGSLFNSGAAKVLLQDITASHQELIKERKDFYEANKFVEIESLPEIKNLEAISNFYKTIEDTIFDRDNCSKHETRLELQNKQKKTLEEKLGKNIEAKKAIKELETRLMAGLTLSPEKRKNQKIYQALQNAEISKEEIKLYFAENHYIKHEKLNALVDPSSVSNADKSNIYRISEALMDNILGSFNNQEGVFKNQANKLRKKVQKIIKNLTPYNIESSSSNKVHSKQKNVKEQGI